MSIYVLEFAALCLRPLTEKVIEKVPERYHPITKKALDSPEHTALVAFVNREFAGLLAYQTTPLLFLEKYKVVVISFVECTGDNEAQVFQHMVQKVMEYARTLDVDGVVVRLTGQQEKCKQMIPRMTFHLVKSSIPPEKNYILSRIAPKNVESSFYYYGSLSDYFLREPETKRRRKKYSHDTNHPLL